MPKIAEKKGGIEPITLVTNIEFFIDGIPELGGRLEVGARVEESYQSDFGAEYENLTFLLWQIYITGLAY